WSCFTWSRRAGPHGSPETPCSANLESSVCVPRKPCDLRRGLAMKSVKEPDEVSISPALTPHLLADGARYARFRGLSRDDTALRGVAGDLEHQLGADRFLELIAIVDRNDEGARAADNAILVIDIEVFDIEREHVGPFHHDGQSVDGDAGIEY